MRLSLLLILLAGCTRDPVPRAETPPPEYEPPPAAAATTAEPEPTPEPAPEAAPSVACVPSGAPPEKKLRGYPVKPLHDLSRDQVKSGGFDTEGIVVRHFVPAPCPPKAVCKPQPPPYLVLADGADPNASLLLETPTPKSFPIGKVYGVSVVVCGTQSYGGVTNEGMLLAAVPK